MLHSEIRTISIHHRWRRWHREIRRRVPPLPHPDPTSLFTAPAQFTPPNSTHKPIAKEVQGKALKTNNKNQSFLLMLTWNDSRRKLHSAPNPALCVPTTPLHVHISRTANNGKPSLFHFTTKCQSKSQQSYTTRLHRGGSPSTCAPPRLRRHWQSCGRRSTPLPALRLRARS